MTSNGYTSDVAPSGSYAANMIDAGKEFCIKLLIARYMTERKFDAAGNDWYYLVELGTYRGLDITGLGQDFIVAGYAFSQLVPDNPGSKYYALIKISRGETPFAPPYASFILERPKQRINIDADGKEIVNV